MDRFYFGTGFPPCVFVYLGCFYKIFSWFGCLLLFCNWNFRSTLHFQWVDLWVPLILMCISIHQNFGLFLLGPWSFTEILLPLRGHAPSEREDLHPHTCLPSLYFPLLVEIPDSDNLKFSLRTLGRKDMNLTLPSIFVSVGSLHPSGFGVCCMGGLYLQITWTHTSPPPHPLELFLACLCLWTSSLGSHSPSHLFLFPKSVEWWTMIFPGTLSPLPSTLAGHSSSSQGLTDRMECGGGMVPGCFSSI